MKTDRHRTESRRGGLLGRFRSERSPSRLAVFLYTVFVFAAGGLLSVYVLDRLDRSGLSLRGAVRRLERVAATVPQRIHDRLSRPTVERITLEIKSEDYTKLARKRADALAQFHLEAQEDDYVPVTIRHTDKTLRARIRLKGDWIDHLDSDKWSFRLRIRGESTLFGMKRFSIQHPKTRNYVYEWIYHEALRREGLVALRYDFIEVTLNGNNLGLYALEEHFERRLVEHGRHPAGPIVRFDESLMFRIQRQHRPFRERVASGRASNTADTSTIEPYMAAEIDAFQSSQALSDPASQEQHTRAIQLLEAFRRGDLRTSEVFDVEALARFFAISDLLGALHSAQWRNMRFYYNPITSLLEPIAFDGDAGAPIRRLSCVVDTIAEERAAAGERNEWFLRSLFGDLAFFEAYLRALQRVAETDYLEHLLTDLDEELQRKLDLLRGEFPEFQYSRRVFDRNQKYLRSALDPPEALHAYYRGTDNGRIGLELGNIQALPLKVLGLVYGESLLAEAPPNTVLPAARMLPPRPIEYASVTFEVPRRILLRETSPEGLQPHQLKIQYRLLGSDSIRSRQVIPWSHSSQEILASDLVRAQPNVATFEFLEVEESTGVIKVRPGSWTIDRDLVVPSGYRVLAGAGTRLNLSESATLLSYSPLHLAGTEERPILVQSEDDTGQGIVVFHAGGTSILDHVAFRNLSSPHRKGWKLSGAVTFYESPVEVSNSLFGANRSEDALHVVRSRFEINRSVFQSTPSDAFDSDFSNGTIRDTRFVDAGNDAIDLSGSLVQLRNVVIDGSGDKALSVGERSQVKAYDLSIRRSEIAVASKDSSTVTAVDLGISDGGIGLTAFRKKSEFGPGSIDVRGLTVEAVATPYLIERSSSVLVEGRQIQATEDDLRSRLYDEDGD